MPRTNPETVKLPNPAQRWFEWRGSEGIFRYYDKDAKANVNCKLPFTFILLNQMATIRGYNKRAKSGIYSNEVRDTRSEPFVVKMFNGEKVAEGFYAAIKDTITAKQGHFATSAYIAFKDGDKLKIGCIHFQGCSLGPWFDFVKENRNDIYKKAVVVREAKKDDSGAIEFNAPVFSLMDVKPETDDEAGKLQEQLKEFHAKYFAQPVAKVAQPEPGEEPQPNPPDEPQEEPTTVGDDVPF